VVYDQANRRFYYRTYDNQNLRRIDLKEINLKPGAQYRSVDLFGGQSYIEDTQRLR
jgi:penicillin V acylase-like amidase (Ntn superfamily)